MTEDERQGIENDFSTLSDEEPAKWLSAIIAIVSLILTALKLWERER